MQKQFLPILLLTTLILSLFIFLSRKSQILKLISISPKKLAQSYQEVPSPTPTPRPLTFAEMNELYGPCVRLPVLMYHHIQDMEEARQKNQTALSVSSETFKSQMEYLKEKGYTVLTMQDLIAFFDESKAFAANGIILTFDDGYDDFYTNALPILNELGLPATVFVPTGLMNNPGYLNWEQISLSSSSGVLFANHTWSHKNMQVAKDKVEFEISTAETQLSERGLNNPKVFAFTYGLVGDYAKSFLESLNYKLAFSTKPGSTLCVKQRYELPRLRVGDAPLSNMGF